MKITARLRAGLAVSLLAVTFAVWSPADAAPAATRDVVLTGRGGSAGDVLLATPLRLRFNDFRVAGQRRDQRLPTAYVGYLLERLPDRTPVIGAVRIREVEDVTQFPGALNLAAPEVELAPGRYRLVLLGPGPVRLVLSTQSTHPPLTWATRTPIGHSLRMASATTASPELVDYEWPTLVSARTLTLLGVADGQGGDRVSADFFCLNKAEAQGCNGGYPESPLGLGAGALSNGGGGGAAFTTVGPGQARPGRYVARFVLRSAGGPRRTVAVRLTLET